MKKKYQKVYNQLKELAKFLNDNKEEVKEDGASIILAIAMDDTATMIQVGSIIDIAIMMEVLRGEMAKAIGEGREGREHVLN